MKIDITLITKIMWTFVIIIMVAEPWVKKWVHTRRLYKASKSFVGKQKQKKNKRIEVTPGIYIKIYDNFKAEVCRQHLTKQQLYSEIAYTKTRIQNNLSTDESIWKSLSLTISVVSLFQSIISPEDGNNATAMLIIELLILVVIVVAWFCLRNQPCSNYMDQIIWFQCDMLESIKRECDEGLLEKGIIVEIDINNKTDADSWNLYDCLTKHFTTNELEKLQSEELEDKKHAESYNENGSSSLNILRYCPEIFKKIFSCTTLQRVYPMVTFIGGYICARFQNMFLRLVVCLILITVSFYMHWCLHKKKEK